MLSDAALHSALLEIIELITAKLGTAKVTLIEKAMRTIERSLHAQLFSKVCTIRFTELQSWLGLWKLFIVFPVHPSRRLDQFLLFRNCSSPC